MQQSVNPFVKKFHDKNRADGRRGFPWPSISVDQDMSFPILQSPGYNSSDSSGSSSGSSSSAYYSTYSDKSDDSGYEKVPPLQEASP